MKKILMLVTFLLMVAMVPVAHATLYTLEADQIWIDTGIVLNGGSITFYGAQTHTSASEIIAAGSAAANIVTSDWTPTADGKDRTIDQWTWGIGYYAGLTPGIPRVWTDANGGPGSYIVGNEALWGGGPPGLDKDEWLTTVAHGMLIGYIGGLNPLDQGGKNGLDANGKEIVLRAPDPDFQNNSNLFGIGTATVTQFGTGTLWIGMNDDFVDYIYGVEDNFGTATGNFNVPEPASMLLLFFGLMGVLGLRRKFKS